MFSRTRSKSCVTHGCRPYDDPPLAPFGLNRRPLTEAVLLTSFKPSLHHLSEAFRRKGLPSLVSGLVAISTSCDHIRRLVPAAIGTGQSSVRRCTFDMNACDRRPFRSRSTGNRPACRMNAVLRKFWIRFAMPTPVIKNDPEVALLAQAYLHSAAFSGQQTDQ
jgi:hypothetical protein